jgi:hypothetical protein
MKDSNHLNALSSLLESLKLNDDEVDQIYNSFGKNEVEILFLKLKEFGETLSANPDEFELIGWLKTLSIKSPSTYNALLNIVKENKTLFDKIQEIFIEKIL